jgi:hypothetical protein
VSPRPSADYLVVGRRQKQGLDRTRGVRFFPYVVENRPKQTPPWPPLNACMACRQIMSLYEALNLSGCTQQLVSLKLHKGRKYYIMWQHYLHSGATYMHAAGWFCAKIHKLRKRGLDSEKIFFISAKRPYDDEIFNYNLYISPTKAIIKRNCQNWSKHSQL